MLNLKRLSLLALAIAGTLVGLGLGWQFGLALGMPLLLFVVSLAVAGDGNRLLWAALFPLLFAALVLLVYAGLALLPPAAERLRLLLAFALMPLLPALLIWLALQLRRRRPIPAFATTA